MGIIAKDEGGADFPSPPTGIFPALCIDVVDLGYRDGPYGTKHQIRLVWQLGGVDDDGLPIVRTDGKPWRLSKFYNLSLNEKATLRLDLESWRGKPFTNEELQHGFDVEQLIGVPCQLHLFDKKRVRDGKSFTAVKSVLPKDKRTPTITRFPEYGRELERAGSDDIRAPKAPAQQRPAQPAAATTSATPWQDNDEDDDLPF